MNTASTLGDKRSRSELRAGAKAGSVAASSRRRTVLAQARRTCDATLPTIDYFGHPRLPTDVAVAGWAFVTDAGTCAPLGTNQTTTLRISEDGPAGTEDAQKLESKLTPC